MPKNKAIHPLPFKDAVRQVRVHRGMTQDQASAYMGIPLQTWASWELGLREPTRGSAIALLKIRFPEITQLLEPKQE